jgi:hypothetical protein
MKNEPKNTCGPVNSILIKGKDAANLLLMRIVSMEGTTTNNENKRAIVAKGLKLGLCIPDRC